ncbi:MAG: ABC transporter permease [bacterium]|nr:ABC transporter permease [bacterium]
MKMITNIALNNNKKNKTRSILVICAIVLTTTLLTIISIFASGMIKMQKENAADTYGSYYGIFLSLTDKQLSEVQRRAELSKIGIMTSAGIIEGNEKGGFVSTDETVRELLPYNQEYLLEEGNYPIDENDIAASSAFFKAQGYSNVQIGDIVSVEYRADMSEKYAPKEFKVSGILQNKDSYKTDASYIVFCSNEFYDNEFSKSDRRYNAYFSLDESIDVSMNNIEPILVSIAEKCGIEKNNLIVNDYYLIWTLDPSYEVIGVGAALALGIVLFSVVIIYNIFQVGIVQKIQEYGKIKALGAKRKQMRALIFMEGMILALIAIPIGLLLGYFVAKGSFHWLVAQSNTLAGGHERAAVQLFSLPMLLLSALISMITVVVALRKPMKIVANISAVEATRYHENSSGKFQGVRKGRKELNVFLLALANVSGNKKRTLGTIMTMGLSCVLFVVIANCVGNIDTEYEARKGINHGQFELKLQYSMDDEAYPENNLDSILKKNPLNEQLLADIKKIKGVTDVITRDIVVAERNGIKQAVTILNREDFEELRSESDLGNMDYDEAVKSGSIFCGWSMWMESDGYAIDQPVDFSLYNGSETINYQGKIAGSFGSAATYWIMPEGVYHKLNDKQQSIGTIYVDCEESDVSNVEADLKTLLKDIANVNFKTYHDELETSEFASRMMKMGSYLFMAIVGLIGFMNLANTMIISITTKKQEYGVLQTIGMTNKQLNLSLQIQGLLFTLGTISIALIAGLPVGHMLFMYAKKNAIFGMNEYHIPFVPIMVMILVIALLQLILSYILSHNLKKESLVERIRYQG